MAVDLFARYDLVVFLIGLVVLTSVILTRYVETLPISRAILFVLVGYLLVSLPLTRPTLDPITYGAMTERLTELGVILALMTAGLKLDRRPDLQTWASTWRLLGITMPLTIALAVLLGWWVGFALPTSVLLGAVIAPTDPVLASEVQVEGPTESSEDAPRPDAAGQQDEVRFALTSEAGLNDGLAFPFTNLAIALALVGTTPSLWVGEWLLIDVAYRGAIAAIGGIGGGWLLARIIFIPDIKPTTPLAKTMLGGEALGAMFLVYGFTESIGGYGFIAVFIAALIIRDYERQHAYYEPLHDISELTEQLLMAVIMILFGGLIADGLFDPLTPLLIGAAGILVFIIRPVSGLIGLIGFDRSLSERLTIAFYGIRGIGTFYYLAYALNHAPFPDAGRLWALAGLTALISITIHGVTATPLIEKTLGDEEPQLEETPTG